MKQLLSHILQTIAVVLGMTLCTPSANAQGKSVVADSTAIAAAPLKAGSATIADTPLKADSVAGPTTSLLTSADSARLFATGDTVKTVKRRDWKTWRPNAKRAMWLAIVLPGAGQIYNRKYWKLPIVYGGFVGCIYAMRWNNQMFRDYSQAYMDIMDDDPNTQSYNQFLHLGAKIDNTNLQRYQTLFKKRKDKFRRWRDLSFFCLVGVYALSIIDAYVDASLSEFDISKDLSLKLEPTIINDSRERNPLKANSLGLSCSLNF